MYEVGQCLLSDKLLQARMTQQELADRLGVTRQQVNHYARNNRIMTYEIAKNISIILNCNMEDLYAWKPIEVRKKRR